MVLTMKKNKKEINIVLVLLIFIIVFEILFLKFVPQYYEFLSFGMILLLLGFLTYKWGIRKDKSYFKKTTIKIVIISLMVYILITYMLGLLTGFSRSVFSLQIVDILKNIIPLAVNIICLELIRYIILKREPSKKQIVLLSIIYIFLNTIIIVNNMTGRSLSQIFSTVTVALLPCIARELLYTYMTYKVGLVPTLILHLCVDLHIFIVPITPALGNYLLSIFGVLLPFLIYKQVHKCVTYKEKYLLYAKSYLKRFLFIFTIIIAAVVIVLVTGLTKYHLIAIGSNSMNPIYYYGDAIVYEKIAASEVKVEDILVFLNQGKIITHRVMKIEEENGNLKFITKGDNNEKVDKYDTSEKDVLGVVRIVVKYIGYPTIKLGEMLGG